MALSVTLKERGEQCAARRFGCRAQQEYSSSAMMLVTSSGWRQQYSVVVVDRRTCCVRGDEAEGDETTAPSSMDTRKWRPVRVL